MAKGERRSEVSTMAEFAEYVARAWDPGGSAYCATKTWFGCGLNQVFEKLAEKESLSAAAKSALQRDLLATMPPCRECRCTRPKSKAVA
jgi:hypothetical protein